MDADLVAVLLVGKSPRNPTFLGLCCGSDYIDDQRFAYIYMFFDPKLLVLGATEFRDDIHVAKRRSSITIVTTTVKEMHRRWKHFFNMVRLGIAGSSAGRAVSAVRLRHVSKIDGF